MTIKPVGNRVQLDIKEPEAGALALDSMPTAIEYGQVIAVGEEVDHLIVSKGDKVFFKAWAVDIINHDGTKYYFLDMSTKGLCAIVSK